MLLFSLFLSTSIAEPADRLALYIAFLPNASMTIHSFSNPSKFWQHWINGTYAWSLKLWLWQQPCNCMFRIWALDNLPTFMMSKVIQLPYLSIFPISPALWLPCTVALLGSNGTTGSYELKNRPRPSIVSINCCHLQASTSVPVPVFTEGYL